MSDGIGDKLFKVIVSHRDIGKESEPDRRLLSGIAAPILIWICNRQTKDWQPEYMDYIKYLYEIGNYNGNRCMAQTLFSLANSAKAVGAATLFEEVIQEQQREAKKAKKDEEVDANYTALHRAAKDGDTDEVKKLLNNPEIDGNDADESGMTPLNHAAKNGHSAVVKLLLDNPEIDRNDADESGMTPLHHAVKHCCSAVVELLVADDKVKINMEDDRGNNPLMLAVVNRSMHQSRDEEKPYYDILNMMLGDPKPGIHAFNHQIETPFSRAFQTGQRRVVKLFLEHQHTLDEVRQEMSHTSRRA